MKKLKFLLIPLISLLFIINVKASTTYGIEYSQDIIIFYENNKNMLEKFDTWLNNQGIIKQCNNLGNCTDYTLNNNYFYYLDVSKYNDTKQFKVVGFPIQNQTSSSGSITLFEIPSITFLNINNNYSSSGEVYFNENNDSFSWVNNNYQYSHTLGSNTFRIDNIVDNIFQMQYIYNNSHGISNLNHYNFSTNNNGNMLKIGDIYYENSNIIDTYDFINSLNSILNQEPTYSYTSTILDNGNVKLDFTFTNYTDTSGYAFEIENNTSNEEYGITNTYSSIFPNQIPFGTSYSIELAYDSLLYVTLAKYEQVEQTSLYFREEIYTNMIDINNVVFENEQDPYFVIYRQTQNLIEGSFANTTSKNTCWYRYSTSQNEDFVPCDEILGLSFYDNGYVEVLIKKGTTTIYSRKINYLGANNNEPYIIYNITKQDFYSVVNWYIENEYSNMTYRYSIDNGQNFTSWINYNNNQNTINVFDNSTIIIEIANNNQSTIYDSKSIIVVNNISEIKNINNTTINFLDKFRSIFSVNTNILSNINNFYDNIKSSKIYLLIFIPFLASLISAIIYLIRRK